MLTQILLNLWDWHQDLCGLKLEASIRSLLWDLQHSSPRATHHYEGRVTCLTWVNTSRLLAADSLNGKQRNMTVNRPGRLVTTGLKAVSVHKPRHRSTRNTPLNGWNSKVGGALGLDLVWNPLPFKKTGLTHRIEKGQMLSCFLSVLSWKTQEPPLNCSRFTVVEMLGGMGHKRTPLLLFPVCLLCS